MADQKQLEILLSGVDKWNEWRTKDSEVRINLSGAKLRHKNLQNANLSEANLTNADLIGSNLLFANLDSANLSYTKINFAKLTYAKFADADLSYSKLAFSDFIGTRLSNANLSNADLTGTDFTLSNLHNANLSKANLSGADLKRADLSGANFESVTLSYTVFGLANLNTTKGLDRCRFIGPCIIDERTLLSSPSLPLNFLRGIGLSEAYIEYLSSIRDAMSPISFYSCFISYSWADKPFAQRLHNDLQAAGIRVWMDEHQLLPGDKIHTEVDKAIRIWDKVILVCSESSLKNSWWVNNEIESAFDKEARIRKERGEEVLSLIPLNLDGYLFKWDDGKATQIRTRLAPDFTKWNDPAEYQREFDKLVKALRAVSFGKQPPPVPKL